MPIGATFPCEWQERTDPATGRRVRQLTTTSNNYALYYFVPTVTPDGRYLIFHSERTGWVQLYRMDLKTGEFVQLTDGSTRDSGWAFFCEKHVRGIYNHLSCLNPVRREVFYFDDNAAGIAQVRATHIDTLAHRVVYELPADRVPVGQTYFSPDGRLFVFIHSDRSAYTRLTADRDALRNMGLWNDARDYEASRLGIPTAIGVIDTATGAYRDVIDLDYHFHHVLFLDQDTLLVNHPKGDFGMWSVDLHGRNYHHHRPRDARGVVCHQVLTTRGINYDVYGLDEHGRHMSHVGLYDPATGRAHEVRTPGHGFIHNGFDPEGRFFFYDYVASPIDTPPHDGHQLLTLHHAGDPQRFHVKPLYTFAAGLAGQRRHAHPLLLPDRQWMLFTDVRDGLSQIVLLDVADLSDRDDSWVFPPLASAR